MSEFDEYEQNKTLFEQRKEVQQRNEQKYQENVKLAFKESLEKKFKTTMIGALASIEKSEFGKLFGYGTEYKDLTEKQKDWREAWEDLRDEILDKGNFQLKRAKDELEGLSVKKNYYRTEFIIQKQQNNTGELE